MAKYYFTTNDIAQMCNVTRQTVINWIKTGKLRASLTPGGHRRVMREELISFFKNNEMNLSIIQDYEERYRKKIPTCWEYFSMGFVGRSSSHECDRCPIKKAQALRCFVLVEYLRKGGECCHTDCRNCSYFKRYHHPK
jgi:excisionase family DNA binding protein